MCTYTLYKIKYKTKITKVLKLVQTVLYGIIHGKLLTSNNLIAYFAFFGMFQMLYLYFTVHVKDRFTDIAEDEDDIADRSKKQAQQN